jgi:DmsE family decaheme c-type cytochrome
LLCAGLPGALYAAEGGGQEYDDLALAGDNVCTRCHDDEDNPALLKIGRTKHGTRADGRTPTCTSCHGESPTHVNKPEGVVLRPRPEVDFGRDTITPVAERNAACLQCHQGGGRMLWPGSAHQIGNTACADCHDIHTDHDKVREKGDQPEVCISCHKDRRATFMRTSHHPVLEGQMKCSDCHNPHGSAGPKLMKRDTIVDTCYQCHMEKRGPFIWNHQPVTENCALCHNPHGANTRAMLRWRPPFLCQQCHEPTSHRGNIPTSDPSTGAFARGNQITFARACNNCHTNIHGGNSPTDSSRSRAFFR